MNDGRVISRLTKGRAFVSGSFNLYGLVITVLDLLPKRLFTKGVDSAWMHCIVEGDRSKNGQYCKEIWLIKFMFLKLIKSRLAIVCARKQDFLYLLFCNV